ncbi:MAG: peroxiredoxin family protein [Gaiellaceae bacterium]
MSTRRWVLGGLALALLAGIAAAFGARQSDRGGSAVTVALGRAAPDFSTPLAKQSGGTFSLGAERGHAVLLSFLNTQAQASSAGDPSRSQIVFLKSMNTQNHPHGLRTVIVDAAVAAGVPTPSREDLINFTFDWDIDPSIAVVGDAGGSIERAYRVTKVPTTLLIDRRGVVRHRWNGFALAAQLDFAIRPLVGRATPGS